MKNDNYLCSPFRERSLKSVCGEDEIGETYM
jgi:hypothetical protein